MKQIVKSKHSTHVSSSRFSNRFVNSKRSQEEMIGFVLIIVLVSIIVLVFLAISIKKQGEIKGSEEIENFLYSSLLYTSSCYKSAEIVYDVKDLVKGCSNRETCLNGEDSCDVLDETVSKLIETSWNIGEDSVEKAYVFKVYQDDEILLELSKGKKTLTKKAVKIPIYASSGDLYVEMEIYY